MNRELFSRIENTARSRALRACRFAFEHLYARTRTNGFYGRPPPTLPVWCLCVHGDVLRHVRRDVHPREHALIGLRPRVKPFRPLYLRLVVRTKDVGPVRRPMTPKAAGRRLATKACVVKARRELDARLNAPHNVAMRGKDDEEDRARRPHSKRFRSLTLVQHCVTTRP